MFDVSQTTNRWPGILSALGVPASFLSKKHGPCPFCGGKDRYRFTDKDGAGLWLCNQCGNGNGMQFVMRYRQVDFKSAATLVSEIIPQITVTNHEHPSDPRPKLRKLWQQSHALNGVDVVSKYLKARNVMPTQLPADIRVIDSIGYFEDGKKIGTYSAMLSLIRGPHGEPKTLHVTYLLGARKAPVKSQKKILSETGNGPSIRLYKPTDELCIAEGIETALAVRCKTNIATWSLISAGNFKAFVCPEEVRRIQIWADNDANCTGQAAAYSLANRLVTEGKNVSVFIPEKVGTDWADQ